MSQVKTAISIQESLFQATEAIAQELHLPRSQVVALALEQFVRRYQNKKLLEQINAACALPETPEEAQALQKMRSKQRAILEDETWT
jgi:metal-responsive CopG/Arc/MetJ family transcriptional regulator